jgi:UDP-GlcNAc:undecaprenyl-phosphate/decaprenyl-phosphate GlcNAc-1-phosphate transferase
MNLERISKIINLYDMPNQNRKIHLLPTPSIGGIFLIINLSFIALADIYFSIFNFNYIVLFCYSIAIFCIALSDDIFNLTPYKKFFFIGLIIFFLLFFNDDKLIFNIVFDFYFLSIESYFLSLFITWLCLMLLLNAINLYDGANGQLATYAIFIFLFFLYENIFFTFSLFILIFLLFFLYYNLNGKIFLGDNGSFVIGFLIGFIVISNNSSPSYLTGEKIFLLMFLPGLDMLRLFIERLINSQNPFIADRTHIHHLLIKKFSEQKLLFINILMYAIPIILSYKINNILLIFISIFLYLLLIYKYLGHRLKK